MEVPEEHRVFLCQNFYGLCFDLSCFTEEEKRLLMQLGHWMEALARGRIKPFTPAQEMFVKVDRGEEAPKTKCEIAWTKLTKQRAEEMERGITLDNARAEEVKLPKPEFGFASDAMWREGPPW